jgi:aminoglycoside phosphotransferase (APT) family kinase protein
MTHLTVTPPPDNQGPQSLSCSINPAPLKGSYNVGYVIEFSDGVKWVARIPGKGAEFEELDIKKMDTDYQTVRFIKACTSIPLPTVFTWETSEEVAGVPFALMSFVEGSQQSDCWFDKSGIKEEKRLKILSGIADIRVRQISFRGPRSVERQRWTGVWPGQVCLVS